MQGSNKKMNDEVIKKTLNFIGREFVHLGLEVADELKDLTSEVIFGKKKDIKKDKKDESNGNVKVEIPKELFDQSGIMFCEYQDVFRKRKLYFPANDHKHKVIIGASRMGKTELAVRYIINRKEGGVGYLDNADGTAANKIIAGLSEERLEKLVIIDHTDQFYPIPLGFTKHKKSNIFDNDKIIAQWVDFFESNFDLDDQYMTQELIGNACRAVFTNKESSIYDVVKIVEDPIFRNTILNRLNADEYTEIRNWWNRFDNMNMGQQTQITASFLRRASILFRDRFLKYTLMIKPTKLDYQKWMDEGFTVVILAPESLGRMTTRVIMSLHVLGFWQATLRRDKKKQEDRRPFMLIADEPQTWLSKNEQTLDNMFSKSMKYGLGLMCLFQTLEQVNKESPSLLRVINGNQPDWLCFRTDQSQINLKPYNIEQIKQYWFVARINGSSPFLCKTLGKVAAVREDIQPIIDFNKKQFNIHYQEIEKMNERRNAQWQGNTSAANTAGTDDTRSMTNGSNATSENASPRRTRESCSSSIVID